MKAGHGAQIVGTAGTTSPAMTKREPPGPLPLLLEAAVTDAAVARTGHQPCHLIERAKHMIRKVLKSMLMIATAVVLVALAVANRQPVTVSFDPFDPSDLDLAMTVPLYVVGFTVLIAGVVLGGVAVRLKQGKWLRSG